MTEQEAMMKVQDAILKRRKCLGLSRSYCTICHNPDAMYVSSDLISGTTECEECFAKRIYKALEPKITDSDISKIKSERVKNVQEYFTKKRLEFNKN